MINKQSFNQSISQSINHRSEINKWSMNHPIHLSKYPISEASRLEVFCKIGVLRNVSKFTGKHLCQRLIFNKVSGWSLELFCGSSQQVTAIKVFRKRLRIRWLTGFCMRFWKVTLAVNWLHNWLNPIKNLKCSVLWNSLTAFGH